jgi:4-hydroxy-tetrahydrodipicolinate reductase
VTSIIVVGACGRMGKHIVAAIAAREDATLVGAVDRADCPFIGHDAGQVAGLEPLGVNVVPDLSATSDNARVLIDFSAPEAVSSVAAFAAERNVGYVCGVTGLGQAERNAISKAAESVPVVQAYNMSLSVNLLLSLVERAARGLGDSYHVEIVEAHHSGKKDAPSGTALALADVVLGARSWSEDALVHGRHGAIGPRPDDEIGLHAVRAGDIVGEHTVVFAGPGERIELTSRIGTRRAFAEGSVQAACWLDGRAPGLYTMAQVLGLGDG